MDFRGEDYQDRFISSLVSFVSSETFQTMFEEFFVNHALEFTNDAEHKLRYHELYQNFHKMFDRQLEIFCDDMQLSQAEFMRCCKAATTDDPQAKHYIDVLMSSVEYETFVKLMRLMRPVAAHRLAERADAKDGSYTSSPAKVAKDGQEQEELDRAADSKQVAAESKSSGSGSKGTSAK